MKHIAKHLSWFVVIATILLLFLFLFVVLCDDCRADSLLSGNLSKQNVLRVFCENWLTTDDVPIEEFEFYHFYYFPLHPTNFYPPEYQDDWLEPLTPPTLQCDVNRDGIVDFIDYAALIKLMDDLNLWGDNE